MRIIDNILNLLIESIKLRWKFFIFCLLAVYWFAALQLSGIVGENFMSPILSPSQTSQQNVVSDGIEKVKKLIEQGKKDFSLKRGLSLIETAYAQEDNITARSYIVFDLESGDVILEKNSRQRMPIASLTKLMSATIALDLAENDLIKVSEKAAGTDPTKIGVVEGQKMATNELLHAALMTSANDAVEVLEEGIDNIYGEGTFVWAMNEKAKYLGLSNSHFDNPQGFDGKTNYATAEDLAILTHYALSNYQQIAEITQKDYYFLPEDSRHKQFDLYNWNGLLGVYPGVQGVKIGNTREAEYTTIVVSQRSGKSLGVVLLGAESILQRDLEASILLDAGFAKKYGLSPARISETDLKAKYSTWKYWR